MQASSMPQLTLSLPAALGALALVSFLGLLLVRGGERAVRLLPPLNVTPAEIEQALERLDHALTALESGEGK